MFVNTIDWKKELPVIKELGSVGWTQSKLAAKYGVSRQRMKQVVDRYIPEWKDHYGHAVNRSILSEEHKKKWGVKEDTELYRSQRAKFRQKKASSKAVGWEWDLSFGDLVWPTHCPILGIELDYFAPSRQENSPSFDKTFPELGYVKKNVLIMSWRANRIKNDGSADEHRKIATYLDTLRNTPT